MSATLIYDGDCPLCCAAREWVARNAIAGGLLAWYLHDGPPAQLAGLVGVGVGGAALGYLAALLLSLGKFYRLLRVGFARRAAAVVRGVAAAGACLVTILLALLVPAGVIWLAFVLYSLS